ncbi:unnamed protein product, partial [Thelazia callipaeda]|uniref:Integrin_alpha2 domain-containing protein n=1 Tax=Thelazia callipaeda TaxID=103827 RepID=A0A0N5CPE8_THECL
KFILLTYSCKNQEVEVLSDQDEILVIFDVTELKHDASFALIFIQDSGKPLPKPPAPVWIPGSENRLFRGFQLGKNGPIEKFILNAIPKIRDRNHPLESIASIVTDFTLGHLLG